MSGFFAELDTVEFLNACFSKVVLTVFGSFLDGLTLKLYRGISCVDADESKSDSLWW